MKDTVHTSQNELEIIHSSKTTPMMQQYHKEKSRYHDHLLFFRVGDFFELFDEDAHKGSQLLDITLTKRHNVAMCGVPAHAIDTYIKRLLKQGQKVALCDQTSPVQKGVLVTREVIEKITPGTIGNSDYLEQASNNYLLSIYLLENSYVCAWIDVSTGDFIAKHITAQYDVVYSLLQQTQAKEVLIAYSQQQESNIQRLQQENKAICFTVVQDWYFSEDEGRKHLLKILQISTLKSLDFEEKNKALLLPVSAILQYVQINNIHLLKRIYTISIHNTQEYMYLDFDAIYNLELFSSMREEKKEFSLLYVLDNTITKMGKRCIKQWLTYPLLDKEKIQNRHRSIAFFLSHQQLLDKLRHLLSYIHDIPRLLTRIATFKAHARDVVSLLHSLEHSLEIIELLQISDKEPVQSNTLNIDSLKECIQYIKKVLADDPPIQFGAGYIIRKEYDSSLDELRDVYECATEILNEYVKKENTASSHHLRLKYNKILGYFFELSHTMRDAVPDYFILRQTLSNADRYKTIELSQLESKILNAEQQSLEKEQLLFMELLEMLTKHIPNLQTIVQWIAEIDVLSGFTNNARNYHYTAPLMNDKNILQIDKGRHPVVEYHMKNAHFIPNSLHLQENVSTFAMITAPNMAGKSTFLRQIALILLMAQVGSYVPAEYAEIGIRDKIFCRVGASDNITRGDSTFLLEMSETAYIIKNASTKSLVIMDEIGRGTSVQDGKALAQAIAEYFISKKIFTLFATHYHSLAKLNYPNIQYLTLSISIHEDKVLFTRKLIPGISTSSYGVEVAQLAGININIIQRSKKLLQEDNENIIQLQNNTHKTSANQTHDSTSKNGTIGNARTNTYFEILLNLKNMDIQNMSPIEAMLTLEKIQSSLKHFSMPNDI